MKRKLTIMVAMAVACAAVQLTAMPTEKETRRAEPVVRKLLEPERKALRSGKKTRSEVADAAMKLAAEADTEAAKLLLMKGAFVLYIQDGNLEKAAETMNALETAIADMPPQSVTNMIEATLLGASKKGERAQLYKLLDEAKVDIASKGPVSHLFPGWSLLNSEVKPELVSHRGQDLVLRMHPKDQKTPVVLKRTVKLSNKNPCLFLKVSSFDGKSDFVLSVRVNGKDVMPDRIVCTSDLEPWEDLVVPLFDWRGDSVEIEIVTRANGWWCEWSHFARIEIAEGNGQETCGLAGVKNGTETVNGYTWSYFVKNGEATVTAAVSPSPKGDITIPATLGGVKVTGLGKNLFDHCKEVTSVTVPEGVTSVGPGAFNFCYGLKSVTIPSSVKTIGDWAFSACFRLQSVTLPESLEHIGDGGFINCRSMKMVNIPAKLSVIGDAAFAYCTGLQQFTVDGRNETFAAKDGILYSKDLSTLVSVPNVSTIARIPSSVTKIGVSAFQGRDRLETLTIPESVTIIDRGAFHDCGRLGSMTIPASVTKIGGGAFYNCGALTEVTMLGERPETSNDIFNKNCGKLKAIHVPAKAKSWAGMKEWFGIPLVFDGEARAASEKALNSGNATSPTPSTNGLWTVKQYNSASPIPSLVEAKELVDKASKVAEQTYQTLSFENNYRGRGCFPHVEFPGTTAGENADYFAIVATGDIYVPNEGDWTFACLNDDGVRFTISGNGLSDTFENDGLGGIFRAPWLRTVHFPRAGIYSVTCLFFENWGIAGLEFSAARGNHSRFDSSKFKLVGDPESGIVMAGDAKDAGRQVKAERGDAPGGALARLRERRMRLMRETRAENAAAQQQQATVDGYTWSYRVKNGEATIVAEKNGKHSCAVSPTPTGDFSIPATLGGVKVTHIGWEAFRYCKELTSVTIPEGVTHIDWNAFCDCRGLKSVTLPLSLKVIGPDAFKECYGLQSVTIPSSVKSIDRGAFFRCGGLTEVAIQQGVEVIGQGVFSYCRNLTSVTIPSSVTNIGTWALSDCSRLKSVTIQGDVKKIGSQAIWNCPELTSVTICGERPEAPNDIFKSCGKLKAIHVPANAKSWAGMKEWQGIPLVFDGELKPSRLGSAQTASAKKNSELETTEVEVEAMDFDTLKAWAESGNATAMCELGSRYRRGAGVRIDNEEAEKWIMKAASNGHERAVGLCYDAGYGVLQDKKEAVKWYRKAVDKGDRCAMNNLGICYERGEGIEQDNTEAAKWIMMAADKGLALAMGNLGRYYYYGIGVDKDDTKSLKWTRIAAEKGDARAMYNLGWRYENGEGLEKDENEAEKWYRKAAENGISRRSRGLLRRGGLMGARLAGGPQSAPAHEAAGGGVGGAMARLRECRQREMMKQQAEAKLKADAEAEEKADRERRAVEAEQAAAEREQQRNTLLQIQEELRRSREEKEKKRQTEADAEADRAQAENAAAQQQQATVDGYTWSYRVNNGNAILTGKPCVSPKPEGVLVVPSIIDGHKVTKFDVHLSFVNCDKMTKIILPDGLESFGFGTFLQGCSSLADIEISKNNPNFTSFKGVLYSKDMKKVVAYPKARDKIELSPQTKIIGRTAFSSCTFIKEMIVPSGIERIESHTFGGMLNLEKIVFPASVNEICWQMFQGDLNLREIIFMGNAPEVHIEEIYGFFYDAPENIVIEVNKGTKGWNGKDSTDIPERWPKSPFGYRDSRPIRFIGEANANNNGSAGIKAAQTVAKEQKEKDLYMVVDLTETGKRAVSYLDEAPRGGWSDEYRTKKIALRKIAPGSFEYLPGKSFTITKPFYIGVFEITQKQYEMVMKVNPSEFKGDMRPVEKVSYIDIRGKGKGLNWPKDNQVDADSYLGKLRKRIGIDFDLPTEVQWEYACRAGTKGNFNVDGVEMVKLGKCRDNGGQKDNHVKVGSFLPNAWGLYDMHGNVWEWCLDRGPDGYVWMNWTADAKETDTDPKGPAVGSSRLHRGGGWWEDASSCRIGRRPSIPAGVGNSLIGLRLACPAGLQ